ncbi:MAG: hypothetical protein ABIF87_02455 [Pseudomonadota bacterium]
MCEYDKYTVEIEFLSSVETPLHADTIFGHICWAYRYLNDEEDLKIFLSLYDENPTQPLLLVSNGFPKGYLPKPVIPPINQEDLQKVVKEDERIEASFKIKTIKKADIIPKEIFKKLQRNKIRPLDLFAAMYENDNYRGIMREKEGHQAVMVQHNTIDRIQGSARRGGLYAQDETFFDPTQSAFEVYLKTSFFSFEELTRIFEFIRMQGFGRDKSTGKGHFSLKIRGGIDLPESAEPNAFMTLSSYVPAKNDPIKGYYNIIHKYGKLGGAYAAGSPDVYNNPFKVPLIMFSAGSTFIDDHYNNRRIYGCLLDNVHSNGGIRHYAYAFPVGISIEDDHADL